MKFVSLFTFSAGCDNEPCWPHASSEIMFPWVKVEPQTTKDKATVIVGKKTGNKTRISKGADAGTIPFTQLDKGKSLKWPRAAAHSGWQTQPWGAFTLITGQGPRVHSPTSASLQTHKRPTSPRDKRGWWFAPVQKSVWDPAKTHTQGSGLQFQICYKVVVLL